VTTFAAPEIVRCPHCERLVTRQSFATINTSCYFPEAFKSILRGDVSCPHCHKEVEPKALKMLARLDTEWQWFIWYGIKSFDPV